MKPFTPRREEEMNGEKLLPQLMLYMFPHSISKLKVIVTVHDVGGVKTRIIAINLGMNLAKLPEVLISIPALVFIKSGEHEVLLSV